VCGGRSCGRPLNGYYVMQQERLRYPCELSYCVEQEIEVVLRCYHVDGLRLALDRFVADEQRFRMGLMATLATSDSGELYIGWNAAAAAACVGHASQEAVGRGRPSLAREMLWAEGGEGVAVSTSFADFHWAVPDCPSRFRRDFLLPLSVAQEIIVSFMESGKWPDHVVWVLDRD
jgi:hypothetical protein